MFYPKRNTIIKAASGLNFGSLPEVSKAQRVQQLPSHPAFQRGVNNTTNQSQGKNLQYANIASAAGSAIGDNLNNPNANRYDDVKGQQINQGIDAVKNLPIIGGFAKGAEGISSSVRGDGTSGIRNTFGDTLGGANTIKSIASGRYKEAIPIYGGFAKARRIKGQMKQEETRLKQYQSRNAQTQSNLQFGTLTFANGGQIDPKKIKEKLNPKNWGVDDYSSEKSFNTAFEKAKKNNNEEFLYQGKRYNTKSDLNNEQQIKRYGIIDSQRLSQKGIKGNTRKKLSENLDPTANYSTPTKGYYRTFAEALFKKSDDRINTDEAAKSGDLDAIESIDYNNLYFGRPQQYNSINISNKKPKNSSDNKAIYYTSKGIKDSLESLKDKLGNYSYEDLEKNRIDNPFINNLLDNRKTTASNATDISLNYATGDYTISIGKDDNGDYISIYDKWDLAPEGNFGNDQSKGLGKPFEIYDKIYLNKLPDGKSRFRKAPIHDKSNLLGGPKFEKGGKIDSAVILGGKGHDEGGNDVIDSKTKQKVAETESHELLLTKTQTETVEKCISLYDKDKDERHLLRLGKEITEIITKFTKDNSGDYDLSKK